MRLPLLLCCCLVSTTLGVSTPATAEDSADGLLRERESMLRFTYDHLELPNGEHLGLTGGNYLLAVRPWLHAGIGVYGAVSGERGGFFTGGFEADLRQPLAGGFTLNGGCFVGGGGGGAAPQGGGLMLRPHAELLYDTGYGSVGVGVSNVWFPNGDIDSTQVAFSYEYPFESLLAGGWLDDRAVARSAAPPTDNRTRIARMREYSVTSQAYFPSSGQKNTAGARGDKTIGLLGAEMRQYVSSSVYLELAAAGAATGDADGFAQVQLGAGYRYPLSGRNAFTAAVSVGAAGGGKVDTGGGFIAAVKGGFSHWFGKQWAAGLQAGYVTAPGGDFHAPMVGMNLTYGPDPGKPAFTVDDWEAGWWQIRGGSQSYLPTGTIRKSGDDSDSVDLIAIKLDRMLTENFYLTGQALAAYEGEAGGYAVGLVGAGLTAPLWKGSPFFASGELLVGAGGGGNIASDGGLLLQPMAGLGWMFTPRAGILASAGVVAAPDGELSTAVADLALVYRFTSAELR